MITYASVVYSRAKVIENTPLAKLRKIARMAHLGPATISVEHKTFGTFPKAKAGSTEIRYPSEKEFTDN